MSCSNFSCSLLLRCCDAVSLYKIVANNVSTPTLACPESHVCRIGDEPGLTLELCAIKLCRINAQRPVINYVHILSNMFIVACVSRSVDYKTNYYNKKEPSGCICGSWTDHHQPWSSVMPPPLNWLVCSLCTKHVSHFHMPKTPPTFFSIVFPIPFLNRKSNGFWRQSDSGVSAVRCGGSSNGIRMRKKWHVDPRQCIDTSHKIASLSPKSKT